jgi:Na+/H+ antiporter NhaD/arsenite permease-like protein
MIEITMKNVSLVLFIAAYVLFIVFPHRRSIVAISTATLLCLCECLFGQPFKTVAHWVIFDAVNWNVMGIFVGTLFVADIFMESRAPAYFSEKIVNRSKSAAVAMLAICGLTSFVSAFVENVAAVLIVAPIALSLARKLSINPKSLMIAIAISSNLQGTATLIGDPPSMLLGGYAKMNFFDFFFYQGKPSIFFAVEIGAVFSFIVLYFVFRKFGQKPAAVSEEQVTSWVPTVLLVALIVLLALSSFLDKGFSYMAGLICMAFGLASAAWAFVKRERKEFVAGLRSLDWDTTFFLLSIFVIVAGLQQNGWIELLAALLAETIGTNILAGFIILIAGSVLISAFVDNVPYLAAMLPVAISLSNQLELPPSLMLFGLLIGASLGGNITPIGASANIVACGILKKEGSPVGFLEFMKIGIPFTLAAVIPAAVFVWLVWR